MDFDYEIDRRLTELTPVVREYEEWFSATIRGVFYPEEYGNKKMPPMPRSFHEWARAEKQYDFIEDAMLEQLMDVHDDMCKTVAEVVKEASSTGSRPTPAWFDSMLGQYDNFIGHLHRIEMEFAQENAGFDPVTGLRSRHGMLRDMEREMERRARKGPPYILALARIDNFEDLKEKMESSDFKKMVREVSMLIKKCLRTFDDAYRSDDGEFIMSLKHSDMRGGTTAVLRMRTLLQEEPVGARMKDGTIYRVTMSYCVGEPIPGDKVEEFLTNMRADLKRYDEHDETALEFIEQSPLLRYLNTTENE